MAVSEKAKLGMSALPEEAREKIGGYKEAPGGGTPLGAGEKAPSKEWVAANRKMQPRDADGQFTYNSVNAKPLEYGPSRGKTVPPFLRGVQQKYARKKGDIIIGEDGKRYLATIDLTSDDLVNTYKRYIESKGDFAVGESAFKGKAGRQSKKEKEAISKGYTGWLDDFNSKDMPTKPNGKQPPENMAKKTPEKKEDNAPKSSEGGNPDSELAKKSIKELLANSPKAREIVKFAVDNNVKMSSEGFRKAVESGASYDDIKAEIQKQIDARKGD